MSQFKYEQSKLILDRLMERVAINSLEQLSELAGVSVLQIKRLQYGLIDKLSVDTTIKLARALQISIEELITRFLESTKPLPEKETLDKANESIRFWQQESQKLEREMASLPEILNNQFQQASIQTIESWLLQWPTAVAAIEKNPDLPAARLIPLVNPVKELVEQWGIETIATVGEELAYDPQWHELMTGAADPGTKVRVRYVGYKQQDKILYKAKVSPI